MIRLSWRPWGPGNEAKRLCVPLGPSLTASVLTVATLLTGCMNREASDIDIGVAFEEPQPPTDPSSSSSTMAMPSPADIVFKDNVESNVEMPEGLDGLVFFDTDGNRVSLRGYLGKKNVVLVFTEGFAGGMLCPFCKTQTSRLVANYDKFAELDTEVLVVYPGARDHLDEFIEAAKSTEKTEVQQIPFPLVLDEDLSAVGYFNIASNLAHPSTFIIDKQGNVRLAYVGVDMTPDRPSIASMLMVLSSVEEQ